ncbi:GNAT family N-acetyltransferase [Lapidilactobacillus wuchangensis]|uniref:GNAT family N-acetyltransferase n=1 Tax=Lapidilactobacillus wuchangensis TaxID=2486001 RepID=UPI0013DE2F10|nr:GNAT family N-acetyltransferase [Lapidilactobacillus wuchangensis]
MANLAAVLENDLPAVQQMYQFAFADLYQRYHDDQTDPYCESLATLTWKWQQPDRHYYFYVIDQRRVGLICVHDDPQDAQTKRISPLLILPKFQGRGYALKMIQAVQEQDSAVTCWQVDTIAQESKLMHFYQRAGFQQTGQRIELQPGMTITYFEKKRSADE